MRETPSPSSSGPVRDLPPGPGITFDDIRACGYSFQHDRETVIDAHYRQILPWLERRLTEADTDFYLAVCLYSFNVCGLRCFADETEYGRWLTSLVPLIQRKIWKFRRAADIPPGRSALSTGGRRKIGFLMLPPNSATIHLEAICDYLARNDDQVEVHVINLGPDPEVLRNCPLALEVHRHFVYFDWSMEISFTKSLKTLRQKTDEIGLEVVFSNFGPIATAVMTAMDLAPVQPFFSHFLHAPLSRLGVKYLMTYGSPAVTEQRFGEENWLVIPSAIKSQPPKNQLSADELARKRATYAPNGEILLAALGRTAKVSQPDFLSAAAEILAANPGTVLLYTSNEDDDPVAAFFQAKELGNRVKNVGWWVDLDDFIPLADVFLDTFPLAGGLTTLSCLAHGKPVISLATPYSYFGRDLEPIAQAARRRQAGLYNDNDRHNPLFLDNPKYRPLIELVGDHRKEIIIADRAAYVAAAGRLIRDPAARERVGGLMRLLHENLYGDADLMGASFNAHLRDIIADELIAQKKMSQGYLCLPDALIAPSGIGRCVNKCRFCLQSHPDFYFAHRPKEMVYGDDDLYLKVLEELPDTVHFVSVTPYTETVLLPNILPRIERAVARGRQVAFETSLVIYNEDFYKKAMEVGLGRILISLNAPTRELYKRANGRDNFDRVIANMEKLIELRNRVSPSTQLHIHIMLFEEFLDGYQAFYDQWKDWVDYIYLQGLCNWGDDRWRHDDFSASGLNPVTLQEARRIPCPFLMAVLLLHPDGNYYICGMAYRQYIRGKKLGCLGHAGRITALEAWNRLTYYRNLHMEERWDELECCADCNAWQTWILYVERPVFEGGKLRVKARTPA